MTNNFLFYLLFFSCFTGTILAQHKPPKDSLLQVWNNESLHDTLRLDALRKMNHVYYKDNNPDTAIIICQTMIEFAQEKDQPIYIARAENTLGVIKWMNGGLEEAIRHYETAKNYFEQHGDTSGAAGCVINMGIIHMSRGDEKKAIDAYIKGIDLCKAVGDVEYQTNATVNLGVLYMDMGNDKEALLYFNEALSLLNNVKNENLRNAILTNMGIIYFNKGNYELAINYFTESMHLAEELDTKYMTVANLSWLAMTANALEESTQALEYVEQGISITEETGNLRGKSELLYSKGIALSKLNKSQESIRAFQESAYMCKEAGLKAGYSKAIGKIAEHHFQQKDYRKTIDNYTRALKIDRQIEDLDQQCTHLLGLGNTYHSLGEYRKALQYKLEAYELSKTVDRVGIIKEASISLYKTYASLGQDKKALEMLELHLASRDSVENEVNRKAILVQQYKFETEKEAALTAQRHEDQLLIEAQQQQNQRIIIWAVIGGLLFAIAFAVLLFKRLKLTRVQKDAIAEARDKAEESERFKEQFLANMSHEIRTPMHAISGMTKILLRNQPEENQMKFLDAMQQSSDNLLVILNDILDLSKIEAGKLDVESIPIRPTTIVNAVFDVMRFKAEEKSLKLVMDLHIDENETVVGDPTRLSQILINLVGNAIKFTENGEVKVILEKQGEQLRYMVKDTGIGIPADKIDKIFSSFEQIDETTTRKFGGTGLGLSITRQLVELQNGKIWAESEEGKGSSFFVELPYIEAKEPASTDTFNEEELMAMGREMEGLRLLLAEDNPFNVMVATDDLEYYIPKIQIIHADDGQVAIDQSKNGEFDIILMDVQMPEVNGLEAAEQIRKTVHGSAIPIIAMTASLLKKEIDQCYAAGMQDYIPKPYTAQQFIPVIHKHLVREKSTHHV